MDILQRIDWFRTAKGWTTYAMAKECGLDQNTILAWYKKGATPSVESIEKLCDGFGITIARFFANEDADKGMLTSEELELIQNWDGLTKIQKKSVLQLIKDIPPKLDQ